MELVTGLFYSLAMLNISLTRPTVSITRTFVLKAHLSAITQLDVLRRSTGQSGSRNSRKLRAEGYIPGVVYGVDEDRNVLKTMISVSQKALDRELRSKGKSFENTLFELNIKSEDSIEGGKEEAPVKFLVTARQTQFNPVTNFPVSVNFLRYIPGNRIRIPIEFINEDQSQDIRRGCFVIKVHRFLECVCDEEIPEKITVDLTDARRGDIIRLHDLKLPAKVRPAKTVPLDFVVGVVKASRS